MDCQKAEKNLENSFLDQGSMFMRYPRRYMVDMRTQICMNPDKSGWKVCTGPVFRVIAHEDYIGLDGMCWENEDDVADG